MPEGKGFVREVLDNPATKDLFGNLGKFGAAQVSAFASRAAEGKSGGEGAAAGVASEMADAKSEGDKAGPFAMVRGALKGFFGKGGGSKRPTNIYEQNFIGVPVEVAYREWKQYSEFPKYMKGPESVSEEDEEGKTKWTAKIFVNRRSWTATVVEDIENYKIRWETEAPKGTINGTVTFHFIDEHLTLMVYVLEYRPKGFFERIGNLNRVVGRRARLDAKHFARYVMMQPAEEDDDEAEGDTEEEEVDAGVAEGEDQPEADGPDTDADGPGEEPGRSDEAAVEAEDEQQGSPDEDEVGEWEEPPPPRSARTPRTPREPRTPR
jgi:uncharacterized membrane protein